MTNSKEFDCKVPNLGPVSTVERIEELGRLGLWRSLMRDAIAKIHEGTLSLISEDPYGTAKTLISVPLANIKNVIVRPLPIGPQLRSAFGKSIGIGIGVGIIIFFIVIAKSGGASRWVVSPVFIVLLCLLSGIVLAFLFSFLPNALRAKALTEFVFRETENRIFVLAVEPDSELEVRDVLTSVGLNVEEISTKEAT
jgi:hypothetical protein